MFFINGLLTIVNHRHFLKFISVGKKSMDDVGWKTSKALGPA
jgi:hypothetical protein